VLAQLGARRKADEKYYEQEKSREYAPLPEDLWQTAEAENHAGRGNETSIKKEKKKTLE